MLAVREWLGENYTLEENPGMGLQGYFYYLHTMTKALSALGEETLPTDDGKQIAWRRNLAIRFLELQNADGSWANTNGRWMEKDPVRSTSYSLVALNLLSRGL